MGRKTDYEPIAAAYDRRYSENRYDGIDSVLRDFVAPGQRVHEVGCGTGHWLVQLQALGCHVTGIDPSAQMLERARARGLHSELTRGRAEALPFPDASFERVACINAIHHFDDLARFAAEARRVLVPGGRVLAIALDPSAGRDRWCIYDYFTPTFELDVARYPATALIRERFADAGFIACETTVAEHITFDRSAREALERNELARSVTSQLTILSDSEYEAGLARICAAASEAEARGEELRLSTDLHLFATFGTVP